MIGTLERILEGTFERLSYQVTRTLPPLLAGLIIVFTAFLLARAMRWLVARAFKGAAADRFFRESGLSSMLDQCGQIKCAPLVAGAAYWLIILTGVLTGLNAFDTAITTGIVEGAVLLLPKLLTAGIILLAGAWLAQYLGRSILVWAVNEEFPSPRRWAAAARIAIFFLSVVIAADTLDFASGVFLAAFVILAGGAVLAGSLALGLGVGGAMHPYLTVRTGHAENEEALTAWKHL
jgi:hypothetical protein